MGIKIENVIITYQKKDILELVYWIRKHILASLKKQITHQDEKYIELKSEGLVGIKKL